jgi:GntR family transcriptional regulator, transcriptional repressor for pyruvate dehydrogenase complex
VVVRHLDTVGDSTVRDSVEPTERLPAYQMLAEELRAQITSGRLRPGDRLPTEPQLCARSGVSRSTVREALRLLASQHLIVTTRGVTGGSFVAQPSAAELAETVSTGMQLMMCAGVVSTDQWLEAREAVELVVAELAAQRRTEEDIAALTAALGDPCGDPLDTLIRNHRTFHLALVAAAGNPVYDLIMRPLYTLANEYAVASSAPKAFWLDTYARHQQILHAVVRRDRVAAREAARSHVVQLRAHLSPAVPAVIPALPGPSRVTGG